MNWHLYAGFLLVTLLLGFTPGPNVALIVVNSATYGVRHGLVTVLGAFGGLVLQVLAVVCGLAALLAGLGHWFALLRWLGVGYLLWLGIRQWRAPSADLSRVRAEPPGRRHMLRQAFLVSCANPKIMLFLGALFPQFISAAHPAQPQVVVLGATYRPRHDRQRLGAARLPRAPASVGPWQAAPEALGRDPDRRRRMSGGGGASTMRSGREESLGHSIGVVRRGRVAVGEGTTIVKVQLCAPRFAVCSWAAALLRAISLWKS
jgi:homoserine/homoserine lactone efflux protein